MTQNGMFSLKVLLTRYCLETFLSCYPEFAETLPIILQPPAKRFPHNLGKCEGVNSMTDCDETSTSTSLSSATKYTLRHGEINPTAWRCVLANRRSGSTRGREFHNWRPSASHERWRTTWLDIGSTALGAGGERVVRPLRATESAGAAKQQF
jgi:hypothetical protein